jgi:hypothetical protein
MQRGGETPRSAFSEIVAVTGKSVPTRGKGRFSQSKNAMTLRGPDADSLKKGVTEPRGGAKPKTFVCEVSLALFA